MILIPESVTIGDICGEALKEAGVTGEGQTATGEQIVEAWARAQRMLQQWNAQRATVYEVENQVVASTGQASYTVGPGGQFNVDPRPAKLESAFLRQLVVSPGNQIDIPLDILPSRADYDRITLKALKSFPGVVYYQPSFPLGELFPWPIPQNAIYALGLSFRKPLQYAYATTATLVALPTEYHEALVLNLALNLRRRYRIPTYPGDTLPASARAALDLITSNNLAIGTLDMPRQLSGVGGYNIFSDQGG